MMIYRRNPEIDLRMGFGKPAEPIDKPFGRKVRRYTGSQDPGTLPPHKAFGARRDLIKRIADDGQ
jgi:hypothetical protein